MGSLPRQGGTSYMRPPPACQARKNKKDMPRQYTYVEKQVRGLRRDVGFIFESVGPRDSRYTSVHVPFFYSSPSRDRATRNTDALRGRTRKGVGQLVSDVYCLRVRGAWAALKEITVGSRRGGGGETNLAQTSATVNDRLPKLVAGCFRDRKKQ